MKALILKSFGGPEAFELSEVPKPVPQAGQVLVRVHATSFNPLDYQVRRGDYPELVPLPAITGHDVFRMVFRFRSSHPHPNLRQSSNHKRRRSRTVIR